MLLTVLGEDHYRLLLNPQLECITELVDAEIGELPGHVNLVYCDDETIQKLNREHRGKDKVTDVLTFTYYKGKTSGDELLGEVLLCIDQTTRQAQDEGVEFEMELYKLFIHGLLHLRGYDHEKDEDYRVMKVLEDKIMKAFL